MDQHESEMDRRGRFDEDRRYEDDRRWGGVEYGERRRWQDDDWRRERDYGMRDQNAPGSWRRRQERFGRGSEDAGYQGGEIDTGWRTRGRFSDRFGGMGRDQGYMGRDQGYMGHDYGRNIDRDYGRDYGRDYDRDFGRRFDEERGWRGEERHRPGSLGQYAQYGRGDQGMRLQRTDRGERGERGEWGPHVGKGPRGYQRNWDRVREDVCDALERDGFVDATEIEVRCDNGEITLSGKVRDRMQKRRAEDVAEHVHGVRDVHNQLVVEKREGLKQQTTGAEA